MPESLFTDWQFGGISETVALAAVAVIGYVFGRQSLGRGAIDQSAPHLERATRIARQLEAIADQVRRELANHHASVVHFRNQLTTLPKPDDANHWSQLAVQAETLLAPTLQLAAGLSQAYDRIRQQSQALGHFTQGRTDPLTGLGNAQALEEQLTLVLSGSGGAAVLAIRVGGSEPGSGTSDTMLRRVAKLLAGSVRDTDTVVRLSGDEFAVLMPRTRLAGACVFGNRLRQRLLSELGLPAVAGVAESTLGENASALLARVDSALYSARTAGTNGQYVHNGREIRVLAAT